jgi:hypothetical protein
VVGIWHWLAIVVQRKVRARKCSAHYGHVGAHVYGCFDRVEQISELANQRSGVCCIYMKNVCILYYPPPPKTYSTGPMVYSWRASG